MRKSMLGAAFTAVASLAVSMTIAVPSASAAEVCATGVDGALVCFYHDGDIMKVKDTKADGHRAVGSWYTSYGRSGLCQNTGGAGTWVTCNYDMREDGNITYRAEVREGTTILRKSSWHTEPIAGCGAPICSS